MLLPNFPIPLFDLTLVDRYLSGYYMDREGTVYSVKSGNPAKLSGSYTPSGRYFTLNKRSFRQDNLQRMAKNHSRFMNETGQTVSALPAVLAQPPAGRTKDAGAAISSKGYLLATLNPKGKLVFGTEPMFHTSETSAKAEAERVAVVAGGEVVLLKIVGKVKVQKAVWE